MYTIMHPHPSWAWRQWGPEESQCWEHVWIHIYIYIYMYWYIYIYIYIFQRRCLPLAGAAQVGVWTRRSWIACYSTHNNNNNNKTNNQYYNINCNNINMYTYICIYYIWMNMYIYTHVCMYIYIERERSAYILVIPYSMYCVYYKDIYICLEREREMCCQRQGSLNKKGLRCVASKQELAPWRCDRLVERLYISNVESHWWQEKYIWYD